MPKFCCMVTKLDILSSAKSSVLYHVIQIYTHRWPIERSKEIIKHISLPKMSTDLGMTRHVVNLVL